MDDVKDYDYTYPTITEEITPGGFIPLYDVVKITLRELQPTSQDLLPIDAEHPVVLKAVAGGSKIQIWENESKTGDPVSLPATYTSRSQFPDELWVEGIETSSDPCDVKLALEYTKGGKTFDDRINITVFDIELTKCPDFFMPGGGSEDNAVSMSATIFPSELNGIIKYTLYDVSDEPGYCMNKPSTVPGSGEDSESWKDLQFEDPQSGFTITGTNKDVATTNSPVNTASVSVFCYDYGAYGKIKAEAQIGGNWFTAHVENGTKKFARIPQDVDNKDDEKYISKGWTYHGLYNEDEDTSQDNDHNGDGLTRYEEYRGVDIDGDGKISGSERLDPNNKDLFVQGSGFGGDFPDFDYGNAFNEADINVHDFVGTVGTDDRNIHVLEVTLENSGGHIIRVGDPLPSGARNWTTDTLGHSVVGGENSYGNPIIYKESVNYYFSDKPYIDNNTWTAPGVWGDGANGVLDPVNPERVEDTNDNGDLDANEKDGNASAPYDDGDNNFDGDYAVKGSPWEWDLDLSPLDIDDDGLVDLGGSEYTKDHVVKQIVTHEMGHAIGCCSLYPGQDYHCNSSTCVMYKKTENWDRDGYFCDDCKGTIYIHND